MLVQTLNQLVGLPVLPAFRIQKVMPVAIQQMGKIVPTNIKVYQV